MKIVYAQEPYPEEVSKTLFLAGPTPRGKGESWRTEALEILHEWGYDGHVFVPEPRGLAWAEDYTNQVEWEEEGLKRADVIVFWVSRDVAGGMPGLTTNDEWGHWKASGKVVWGSPDEADNVRYQKYYAKKLKVPTTSTLKGVLGLALQRLGNGASRFEGETWVPLHIWSHPQFQAWYQSQLDAGNSLAELDVEWSLLVGPKRDNLVLYAVKPSVYVTAESRFKANEVVVLRSDISSVFLYHKDEVVLVREFRSPVRNPKGYVYELPGGSSPQGKDPAETAAEEVSEEIGLELHADRLVALNSRQMGATLNAYHSHLFTCELTAKEMLQLKTDKSVHGAPGGEERCTIHVVKLEDVFEMDLDWPMLGMIFEASEAAGL